MGFKFEQEIKSFYKHVLISLMIGPCVCSVLFLSLNPLVKINLFQ